MSNILTKIEKRIPKLSKGQKKIAFFILENYDKVAFMTASKVALEVDVSESTVVRFAMEIGFEGYPSFQKNLKEVVKTKLTSLQRIEITNTIFKTDDFYKEVMLSDIDKIKKTLDIITEEDFKLAADMILNSKNIYIIGSRSSFPISSFLHYYLKLMLKNIYLVNAYSTNVVLEDILDIEENDLAIGIAFPRYSKSTINGLIYAKDMGANILSITDSKASPLNLLSDHSLLCNSDMTTFVDSLIAPISVINALLYGLGLKKENELSSRFNKLEDIWDKSEIYTGE